MFRAVGIFNPDMNKNYADQKFQDIWPNFHQMNTEFEMIIDGNTAVLFSRKSAIVKHIPGEILFMCWGTIYNLTFSEVVDLYRKSGIQFLHQLNGKFGIIIWDAIKKVLYCAVDRFGIERIYYSHKDKTLIFSSHITPILKSGLVEVAPNYEKLYNFIKYSSTEENATFFDSIKEIPMGYFLTMDQNGLCIRQWYSINEHVPSMWKKDLKEGTRLFMDAFYKAVEKRMKDGDSVGIALSGGIDSSAIVQIASEIEKQKAVPRRLHIFSLRFPGCAVDEGPFIEEGIKGIKEKVGEENVVVHNINPEAKDFESVVTEIIKYFEEPFHKIHTFMLWVLSEKAAEVGVPYVLFGQGAESIIGGQSGDDFVAAAAEYLRRMRLKSFWKEAVSVMRKHNRSFTQFTSVVLKKLFPKSTDAIRSLRESFSRDNSFLSSSLEKQEYRKYKTPRLFRNILTQSIYGDLYPQQYEFREFNKHKFSDDVDVRFPFMDHELAEIAYSLPNELKIHRGVSKIVLREDSRYLPEKVRNRTDKMMSANVMKDWFRGPLRDFVQGIIGSKSFRERGLFNLPKIEQAIKDHNDGIFNWSKEIARWVSIELWFRYFIDTKN